MSNSENFNPKEVANPEDVWNSMIELDQGTLNRHALFDIPGSLFISAPQPDGTHKARIFGRKLLKDKTKLPKLISKPTVLHSSVVSKTKALNLSYLSFVSTSMSNEEEVSFTVIESSFSSIVDNDIDWDTFDQRVKAIREDPQNRNLHSKTTFGIVKVASVIAIEYQRFKNVNRAAKIDGWGFSASGKHLSETSKKQLGFRVGIALAYSSNDLGDLTNSWVPQEGGDGDSTQESFSSVDVTTQINQALKKAITQPATLEDGQETL